MPVGTFKFSDVSTNDVRFSLRLSTFRLVSLKSESAGVLGVGAGGVSMGMGMGMVLS